jgi:5-methylcytosine-specific restriction endonuclease McrA
MGDRWIPRRHGRRRCRRRCSVFRCQLHPRRTPWHPEESPERQVSGSGSSAARLVAVRTLESRRHRKFGLSGRYRLNIMSDPRYSTSLWQRTRKFVIARDQACMLQTSLRCNRRAETAHHMLPSSLYPQHFFDVDYLVAACKPCNFGDGAKLRNANARNREAQLRSLVEEQRQEIERLLERLSRYETPDGRPVKRPMPAIY